MLKIALWIPLGFLLTLSSALAQNVVQSVGPNGAINFTQRTVTATGIGMPGGPGGTAGIIRAAKLEALRNLLETINGITITASSTVENQTLTNDVIRTRVEGIANNFRMVGSPRYNDDGSIEVTIEMSLDGPFLEAVMPEMMGGAHPLASAARGGSVVYTGLIIDAQGLGAWPALAPRLLNEDGQEVYGSSYVSREWAIKYGLAGYEKELSAAQTNDRVGANPLLARGLRTTGQYKTDIIISNQDAQALHSMKENLSFLSQCRVIIIVD